MNISVGQLVPDVSRRQDGRRERALSSTGSDGWGFVSLCRWTMVGLFIVGVSVAVIAGVVVVGVIMAVLASSYFWPR